MTTSVQTLFTIRQFCEREPAWTPQALRNLILNAEDRLNSRGEKIQGNGLKNSGAIVRVGNRVLIDDQLFLAWARGAAKPTEGGIVPTLRYYVLKRDRFACVLCGARAARGAVLHVDHKTPKALGGQTCSENLQTLCESCNRGKGTGP